MKNSTILLEGEPGLRQALVVPPVAGVGKRHQVDVLAELDEPLHQRHGVLEEHHAIAHPVDDHEWVFQSLGVHERETSRCTRRANPPGASITAIWPVSACQTLVAGAPAIPAA